MGNGTSISSTYADLLAFVTRLVFGAIDITVPTISSTSTTLNASDVQIFMKDVGQLLWGAIFHCFCDHLWLRLWPVVIQMLLIYCSVHSLPSCTWMRHWLDCFSNLYSSWRHRHHIRENMLLLTWVLVTLMLCGTLPSRPHLKVPAMRSISGCWLT